MSQPTTTAAFLAQSDLQCLRCQLVNNYVANAGFTLAGTHDISGNGTVLVISYTCNRCGRYMSSTLRTYTGVPPG